ncbi:HVA22-like protein a [Pyrus ussuriensis x Pyrus communis]|uniref:HVA22-like protein n=1 Tax=Pyrus ussuriensis x Pyrus communis TaxID=2448454 RepID=A0A5N5HHA2_9ROSA|nr:HVA22-like protein a [Pyrus ussuriensis x Pyrus communis]
MVIDIIKVLVHNFDVLAMPVVSIVYPLYASIRALETMSNISDDRQWLTYWILYSMITTFELTFSKLIMYFWLVCPRFSGSTYIYQNYVRPFYLNHVTEIPVLEGRSNVTCKTPETGSTASEKVAGTHLKPRREEHREKARRTHSKRRPIRDIMNIPHQGPGLVEFGWVLLKNGFI